MTRFLMKPELKEEQEKPELEFKDPKTVVQVIIYELQLQQKEQF